MTSADGGPCAGCRYLTEKGGCTAMLEECPIGRADTVFVRYATETEPITCDGCLWHDDDWGCRADVDECPGYIGRDGP